eukprot:1170200-Heterocapsa_arctica.AAC.1
MSRSPCSLGFWFFHLLILASFQIWWFPGLRFPGFATLRPKHVFVGESPNFGCSNGRFVAQNTKVRVVTITLHQMLSPGFDFPTLHTRWRQIPKAGGDNMAGE